MTTVVMTSVLTPAPTPVGPATTGVRRLLLIPPRLVAAGARRLLSLRAMTGVVVEAGKAAPKTLHFCDAFSPTWGMEKCASVGNGSYAGGRHCTTCHSLISCGRDILFCSENQLDHYLGGSGMDKVGA